MIRRRYRSALQPILYPEDISGVPKLALAEAARTLEAEAGECERTAVAFGRQLSSIASQMRLANWSGLQKVTRDVTKRKQAQDELQQVQQQLLASQKLKP